MSLACIDRCAVIFVAGSHMANCHGLEAKGGGIAPDLTASKLDPQQMFRTIHDGRTGTLMPSWGKQLSSDEIWKVITYLRSPRQGK